MKSSFSQKNVRGIKIFMKKLLLILLKICIVYKSVSEVTDLIFQRWILSMGMNILNIYRSK